MSRQANDVAAIGRDFRATCPQHGDFIYQNPDGHHSTSTKSKLRSEFNDAEIARIKSQLDSQSRKRFEDALGGWRIPTQEEVDVWKSML